MLVNMTVDEDEPVIVTTPKYFEKLETTLKTHGPRFANVYFTSIALYCTMNCLYKSTLAFHISPDFYVFRYCRFALYDQQLDS